MSDDRLKEIFDSINLQMIVEQNVGYRNKYSPILTEEIDLYNAVIKYKEVINKAIALLEDDNICADIRRNKPIDDNRGLPFPKCIVEYGVEKELLSILKEVEDK